jgi:glucuronoxylan 4-O-methyltransferase
MNLTRSLASLGRKVDSVWQRIVGHGFRVTGLSIFTAAFHWRRDILLSREELGLVAAAIRCRPGSLLVFGVGNDSMLWDLLNRGYPTVFLESDAFWMKAIGRRWRSLQLHRVVYAARLSETERKMRPDVGLVLPEAVRRQPWDIILVDAPQGWGDGPGRRQSIFEAGRLLAQGGRIFVHDCDRQEEQLLTARHLGHLRGQKLTERLWMFQ